MKKSNWFLVIGLFLFAGLLFSSIMLESPLLLYLASAVPMFVVPFFPDLKTSQRLRPDRRGVEIVKLSPASGEEAEWIVVNFQPGTVYWNKKILYVPIDNAETVDHLPADEYTASLTVLKYDLRIRKSKPGTIGIYLPNLIERTANLPFTIHEVNRLMIRMEDLDELLAPSSVSAVRSRKVELQA